MFPPPGQTQLHLNPTLRNVAVYAEPVQGHLPHLMEVNGGSLLCLCPCYALWGADGFAGL